MQLIRVWNSGPEGMRNHRMDWLNMIDQKIKDHIIIAKWKRSFFWRMLLGLDLFFVMRHFFFCPQTDNVGKFSAKANVISGLRLLIQQGNLSENSKQTFPAKSSISTAPRKEQFYHKARAPNVAKRVITNPETENLKNVVKMHNIFIEIMFDPTFGSLHCAFIFGFEVKAMPMLMEHKEVFSLGILKKKYFMNSLKKLHSSIKFIFRTHTCWEVAIEALWPPGFSFQLKKGQRRLFPLE